MSAIRPAILLGALIALTATDADAGGADRGKKLAEDLCKRCHNIEPNGPFKQYPPSFASIAVYRSGDQICGRIMYPPMHSNMPELGFFLTPNNVDDIVDFVLSLEKQ